MTITRSDSRSPAAGGNFSRNKSGPKYTSSSRRKSHLSPARSNRGASLPSSLSVCWYDRRESLSISVSAVLFFVELESTGGIISLLFSVEIGDNFQRLPVSYNEFRRASVCQLRAWRSMATIRPENFRP